MLKWILLALISIIIGAVIGGLTVLSLFPPNDIKARAAAFEPENRDWFFQNASEVFPTRTVSTAGETQLFGVRDGALEGFTYRFQDQDRTLEGLYEEAYLSGLIILHNGEIVHESYGRGADAGTLFTTWSMVKSITSTLVGFAVKDGLIASVDDPLMTYLPELAGTAYEGVTVKQALQMSSGVRFDPNIWQGDLSDTVDVITNSALTQKDRIYNLAIAYPRETEPGTDFNYNTAESQVLLELVRRVTGKTASQYLEEKAWRPLGMAHDGAWILDQASADGAEIGGAMFNASLRDWARFGQFIEQDGVWNGEALLPEDWVDRASVSDEPHLMPGETHPNPIRGYGWHWWTYEDGTFTASGANGQGLFIDRANNLVIARASAWPEGYVREYDDQYYALYQALGNWFAAPPSEDAETAESEVAAP